MAGPFLTANSQFGLIVEATRGTLPSSGTTYYLPVVTPQVSPMQKFLRDEALRGSPVSLYDNVAGVRHDEYDVKGYVYADSFPILLRAILGGTDTVRVNVRVIAATNKDMEKALADGTFREDLYYRLNVFTIFVPPLRDRKADLLLLADHFLEKFSREHGKVIKRISTPAIDMLMAYHWPGNIRQLRNVIERMLVLDSDGILDIDIACQGVQRDCCCINTVRNGKITCSLRNCHLSRHGDRAARLDEAIGNLNLAST